MPQQLIYTSAPRGLVAGRSGHCTVARSASMREALMLQLEKLCYYQHLSLSGGQERPIFSYRIVDIRGSRFHVVSRIQDAGLDFTGRTNFIAHHLVLAPEELRQSPIAPVILRDWPGWVRSWTTDPQLLESEDWSSLTSLMSKSCVPAQTWQRITGDAVNGYGLLESRAGASFRVDDQTHETVLGLLAESMELLEVRDTRRDFRTSAWNHTFTTSMQEQDNPADFRWRCIHSDNPAANRFATPDCRLLSAVRANKLTGEETAFARTGRQAPQIVIEPHDIHIVEGETARLNVKAEGVPSPTYHWFTVDKAGNKQTIGGENGPELTVASPPRGLSRYIVRASNSAGEVTSKIATLTFEPKHSISHTRPSLRPRDAGHVAGSYVKSDDDIERQRQRLRAKQAEEQFRKSLRRKKILCAVLTMTLIVGAAFLLWFVRVHKKSLVVAQESTFHTNHDSIASTQGITEATIPQNSATPPDASASASPLPQRILYEKTRNRLPPPWSWAGIGNNTTPPEPIVEGDRFTIIGPGNHFSGHSDSFFFASQSVTGSVEFVARLVSVSGATNESQCGIMFRESNQPDSAFVFIGISAATRIICTYRSARGTVCQSEEVDPVKLPIFLRLRRSNDVFVAEISPNDANWHGKTKKIAMTESNYFFGFAVTSGKPALVNAVFDRVTNRLTEAKP